MDGPPMGVGVSVPNRVVGGNGVYGIKTSGVRITRWANFSGPTSLCKREVGVISLVSISYRMVIDLEGG
jgi:hypothetical protein